MYTRPPVSPGDDENLTVSLTVSLHKVWDEQCIIDLELTNTSTSDLELDHYRLPWRNCYSMTIVVADTFLGSSPLPHPTMIDDPPITFTFTTIKPGESLKGEIPLVSSFPDLVMLLKDRETILFWAYQPITVRQIRGKWVGGWLLLPKLASA